MSWFEKRERKIHNEIPIIINYNFGFCRMKFRARWAHRALWHASILGHMQKV